MLDIYKTNTKATLEIKQSNQDLASLQQVIDEGEQQTVTSEVTEQSELNELIDDFVIDKPKKILNRFNFCEQGIQTYITPKKVVWFITFSYHKMNLCI